MQFIGIQTGSNGYKLQHIVLNDKGQSVAKSSDIVLWLVYCNDKCIYYFPISKLDLDNNITIVPAQICSSINDRTRTLIKVSDTGNSIIPSGVLVANRRR